MKALTRVLAVAAVVMASATAFAGGDIPCTATVPAAPVETAQPASGYRSYSYQPASNYYYSPARRQATGPSYTNPTNKSNGRVN
jgi:hypothetical protein